MDNMNQYYEIKGKNQGNFLSRFSLTTIIIFTNVLVYFFIILLGSVNQNYLNYFALNANNIFHGKNLWTLLTHMFSHVLFFHLFANMFSLWFLGRLSERIIGRRRFILFYLSSGILAGFVTAILSYFFGYGFWERVFGSPAVFMLGASGAIFGLAGLLAALIPKARVYLIIGPLIAIIIQAIIAASGVHSQLLDFFSLAVSLYIIFSIFSMLSFNPKMRRLAIPIEISFQSLPIFAIVPLIIIGIFLIELPIGNIAHLAGYLMGLIYGSYLKIKYKRKVMMLQRMFR